MKKLVLNCTTGQAEEIDLTPEEIAQQEIDRLAWEAEQAQPKPPTTDEQLKALNQKFAQLNDDMLGLSDYVTTGGV